MSIRFPKRSWFITIAACAAAASAHAQAPAARTNSAPPPVCAAEQHRVQVKSQPSPDAYLALGGCFLNANRPQAALDPLHHAVQLGPGIETAHRMLADALSRLDRNQEAETEWRAALKIEPASKPALDGLARSLMAQDEPEKVITLLADADRDENLTIDLSQAYHKIGQLDDEGHVLREALKADPDSDRLTAALVSHLVDTLYTNDAMQLSEDIARRKPDDVEAQRILFRTLVLAEERSRALALGERLLTIRPHDADLLNLTGLLEYRAGEFDASRKHLQEAVALNPNDFNSRVNLGKVLAEERDPAGAALQFKTAISLGTDSADVHFLLSRALRALGKTAEAQQQAAIAEQKQKNQIDRSAADLKASLAAESVKAGDNQRAAELYREACEADPGDAGLQYRLAMVLDALGDAAGEREALGASIKANPKFALAQYQLGYMDFRAGNNAEAEQHFRATVEAVPDNAQAWLSLAATLATEQRIPEAREAVANALKADPSNARAQNLSRKLNEQH
jgi:tetratricopeptide (TPR) repeat protein